MKRDTHDYIRAMNKYRREKGNAAEALIELGYIKPIESDSAVVRKPAKRPKRTY